MFPSRKYTEESQEQEQKQKNDQMGSGNCSNSGKVLERQDSYQTGRQEKNNSPIVFIIIDRTVKIINQDWNDNRNGGDGGETKAFSEKKKRRIDWECAEKKGGGFAEEDKKNADAEDAFFFNEKG